MRSTIMRLARVTGRLRLAALVVLLLSVVPLTAQSQSLSTPDFQATWAREDQPVATGAANRTWLWGPEPFTGEISEPYGGSVRTVQYFDKARMEINDPNADRDRWYVTTGLLTSEMMTGALQTSDHSFEQRGPALIPVAGDADDPDGPTYASFDRVRNHEPFNTGTTLTATIDRDGNVGHDQHFARYPVLAEHHVPQTGHSVASVFWTYLNLMGPIAQDGVVTTGRLFDPWFYATGFPVTEAYWTQARVGGQPTDVLIQMFERRVLTYTPSNDPAWRVEMGNVGLHYHAWRYEREDQMPVAASDVLWMPDLDRIVEPGSWLLDPEQQTVSLTIDPVATHTIASRYWHGGSTLPDDGYRASVEVRMNGPVVAGIGTLLKPADNGGLDTLLFTGVSANGVRHVFRERFDAPETEFLLRPAGGLPGWDAAPGAWNEIAVTVHEGRAWIEIGSILAGEIEVSGENAMAGIALVAEHTGRGDTLAGVTFRNLSVQGVTEP